MIEPEINGHRVAQTLFTASDAAAREHTVRSLELALGQMKRVLLAAGFSEYEAGQVSLSTRTAITQIARQRMRQGGT